MLMVSLGRQQAYKTKANNDSHTIFRMKIRNDININIMLLLMTLY